MSLRRMHSFRILIRFQSNYKILVAIIIPKAILAKIIVVKLINNSEKNSRYVILRACM